LRQLSSLPEWLCCTTEVFQAIFLVGCCKHGGSLFLRVDVVRIWSGMEGRVLILKDPPSYSWTWHLSSFSVMITNIKTFHTRLFRIRIRYWSESVLDLVKIQMFWQRARKVWLDIYSFSHLRTHMFMYYIYIISCFSVWTLWFICLSRFVRHQLLQNLFRALRRTRGIAIPAVFVNCIAVKILDMTRYSKGPMGFMLPCCLLSSRSTLVHKWWLIRRDVSLCASQIPLVSQIIRLEYR
jgi:hypothetical protein